MIGHRLMGTSLTCTGDIAQGRAHCNQALALYDAAEHRPLATRFGQDLGVSILIWRSEALWLLGFPKAAVADADHAVKDAREIGQVATLMYALYHASTCHIFSGNFAAANALLNELVALADKKDALLWKAFGVITRLAVGPDWQSLERYRNDYFGHQCVSVNGSKIVVATVFIIPRAR